MRDIFFFSGSNIDLADVRDILSSNNNYDLLLNSSKNALEIKMGNEIVQMAKLDISKDFGDPEDLEVIKNTGMKTCFCVSHHSSSIDLVKDYLKKLLEIYGGWVGNDSEGFEPRFILDEIDFFEYSE
jgi:hypothetical protein